MKWGLLSWLKHVGYTVFVQLEGGFSSTRFSSTLKLVPEDCVSWYKVSNIQCCANYCTLVILTSDCFPTCLLYFLNKKVIRVDALYWAATDPELVANCHKLPVFVELTSQEPHHYGLPAFEYPGLLKVHEHVCYYM